MRVIVIGAGRGSRLMPITADAPKCFAEVAGKSLLDWSLAAFAANQLDPIAFIGGYQIDKVRARHPQLQICHNDNWKNNNILASLFYAEHLMNEPFICCYADILFTADIVRRLASSDADIALGVDTAWLVRYKHRSQHPSDDAEKVTVRDGSITRVHRNIPEREAHGEFIGIAKFSARGAAQLREHFQQRRREFAGRPWREAKVFEKAYLIHLLQDMIESGRQMTHVDTPGGYIEVDTQEDFEYARRNWVSGHLGK